MQDMQSSECTVLPEAASVSTPSPETTPSPGKIIILATFIIYDVLVDHY